MVIKHRHHVLGPHLLILSFSGCDGRGVLPEQVGANQRHELSTVGSHQPRLDRHSPRGLEHLRRGFGLFGRLFGVRPGRTQPSDIGSGHV